MMSLKIHFTIIIFSLLFPVMEIAAQDESYFYGANFRPLENAEEAKYKKEVYHRSDNKHVIRSFQRENESWDLSEKRIIKEVAEGEQKIRIRTSLFFSDKIERYYQTISGENYQFRELIDDKLFREGVASELIPLQLDGELTHYYPNGRIRSVGKYKNNQLIENENWLRDGTRYIDNIFYSVDKLPEYKLGYGLFRDHIMAGIYESGYNIGMVEDEIILGWVIMEDGTLAGVHRVEGKLPKLTALLTDLVESLPGEWSPARLNGEAVRYYMTIPFNFRQEYGSFESIEMVDGYLIWD